MTFTPQEVARLAHKWMRSAGTRHPHVDPKLYALVEDYHKRVDGLLKFISSAAPVARKALYAAEDAMEKAQQAWVADGNHLDDFTDPRGNPDGYLHERAVRFAEMMDKEFGGKSGNLRPELEAIEDWLEETLGTMR